MHRSSADHPGDAGQISRIYLQASLILLVCLVLTAQVWRLAEAQANKLAETRFEVVAVDVTARIVDRLHDYAQILRGGVGLMEVGGDIGREEWRGYVERLDVERRYPGIQGIGFARHVAPGALAIHERAVRDEGFAGYGVTPPGRREIYYPIQFLEPFTGRNLRAFGYDMYSEPVRRAAMARARDDGVPALSAKVVLVQETDTDVQAGTLLYLPYYQPGADVSTREARRAAIRGFVYSPFRMNDLMTGVLGPRLADLQVAAYDGEPAAGTLLFGTPQEIAGLHIARDIEIFGRRWHIDITPTPAFAAALHSDRPGLVLAAGIIISLLLTWVTQSMVAARLRSVALAESNRRLAAAQSSAEAANLSKSRFFASASHDIRQPAQSLMLLIGALASHLAGHPARALVDHMERALDALRSLLDGLLDISKLDAGVVEPQFEAVGLESLFAQLAEEFRLAAAQKGLELRIVPTTAWVRTDPLLFGRILRNLLENAVRYTTKGRILLGCRRQGGKVWVEVWDTGIGIPADQLERVFEEFHQVGNPERDRAKGLGLGLAIVRRLAQLLGHDIAVRSALASGSVFRLSLPRARPEPEPGRRATREQNYVGTGTLVVVIDDEEMVRDSLRLLLEGWGCRVVAADGAEGALAQLAGKAPAVILADYRLRGDDTGIDAIERLQQAFPGGDIRGIVLTGDTAPGRIAEATRSGFRILHKPIAAPELQDVLAAE